MADREEIVTGIEVGAEYRKSHEQIKIRLTCPNAECGLDFENPIMEPALGGGVARGRYPRRIKTWWVRPTVEAEDDPIIQMSVPREALRCPDCGTRGYVG